MADARPEERGIVKSLEPSLQPGAGVVRWMVEGDDRRAAQDVGVREDLREGRELVAAEPPRGDEGSASYGARETDDGGGSAQFDDGKAPRADVHAELGQVADQVISEVGGEAPSALRALRV